MTRDKKSNHRITTVQFSEETFNLIDKLKKIWKVKSRREVIERALEQAE